MSKVDDMNAKMVKFVPELASDYARYPLKRDRWLEPKEKGPKDEPCFISSSVDAGPKPDYVFGRGKYGHGYYSLLTQYSYQNLYARLTHEAPGGCCACSKAARQEYDAYDDVKRIVYNRSVASRPDDVVASKDALRKAQGVAQVWHNGLQNEQLAIGAVQFATM